jgi:S-formylglutathione hydrolase FrmB
MTVSAPIKAGIRRAGWFAFALGAWVSGIASPAVRVTAVEPRVWRAEFQSGVLKRTMPFLVILPEGCEPASAARVPVIYFLHGRGRDEATLLGDDLTRSIILSRRCALVLPRGEDGWYVDSRVDPTARYATYLDEVISTAEACFPVRQDMAGRAIGGWSMGGYGAAYNFARRSGDFAALATIIGIVDYPRDDIEPADQNYPVQSCFGRDRAVWADLNPRTLIGRASARPMFVAYAEDPPRAED